MSFFKLEILKGQPTKSISIMPQVKLSKTMLLGQNFEKQIEIIIHRDL
jgi:hypothetical protein